jgi:hypothetical protein
VALVRQRLQEQDRSALEAAIGQFYRCYQGVSTWIDQGRQLISFQARDDPQYLSWRAKDAEFLNRLNELSAQTGYETLRNEILGVGWGEGTRPLLIPAMPGQISQTLS